MADERHEAGAGRGEPAQHSSESAQHNSEPADSRREGNSITAGFRRSLEIVWELAVNDIALQYAGSALGILWAVCKPVVTMLTYAIVFQYGMHSTSPMEGVAYMYWFAAGMVPWFLFSDLVRSQTTVFLDYSYLVRKVMFRIELLPWVKLISNLLIHAVFLALLVVIALLSGGPLSIYVLQVPYYLLCTAALTGAIGLFSSALVLYFRDLKQIVNIALDIGLWATPVIWSYTILSPKMRWIAYINPVFYLTEGYRDSFPGHTWFFEHGAQTVYFWALTAVLWVAGRRFYRRLRPGFADVL